MCKFWSHLPGFCAGRDTAQSVVAPLIVVVIPKSQQLPLQVASSPKGHLVEKLPPDRRYEPFHEGLRERCIGHGLHFRDLEKSKVGLPSMKLEQRIMIAAVVSRRSTSTDRAVEHPADRWPIHGPYMYPKTDNPARELIHHHQHPMALEVEGVAPKQIDAQ